MINHVNETQETNIRASMKRLLPQDSLCCSSSLTQHVHLCYKTNLNKYGCNNVDVKYMIF
jgi:hypothetical protein